jgi:hypothetical protein
MVGRLRFALMSVAALLVTALLGVVPSGPAQASAGQTCMDPDISGSYTKTVKNFNGIPVTVVRFSAEGHTSANCPTALTDYRYKLAYTYNGNTVSTYQDSIDPVYGFRNGSYQRIGTSISFPDQTLTFAGYKPVSLAVTAGSKSTLSSVWCRSNEETTDYQFSWPTGQTSWGFTTADDAGVPRAKIQACP